ncbi:multidrug ABC transporter substrate-binding protein [Reticulibacter mediterranei]|uniref:Multidrug ABC transporter substrate-binding protein n=2 Tax=Reticulibacter mediterranei TaxID=2778369 RepID=A0A8J3IYW1_9CHLR|nr:multidrug ABC transporter substrate-binding protein [Reticulibacter mediterranei]
MFGPNFRIALEALWSNRVRSFLTTLGIFIGIAAVIAALTLTQGVSAQINSSIMGLGTNVITAAPGAARTRGAIGGGSSSGGSSTPSLTLSDVAAIKKVTYVTDVSPVISVSAQVVYSNQNWNTKIEGVDSSYQTIEGWNIAQGMWFSESDEAGAKPVAILGQTVVDNLFATSGVDPIGQTIRIRDQLFKVVGVLEAKGSGNDDIIMVPSTTALNRLKTSIYVDQIIIQVSSSDVINLAQQEIDELLRQQHHLQTGAADDFNLTNSSQLLQTANQFTTILTALFVGVAAISLTVGGIGIMNIMLVSVTERTREIGIRMSIGARRQDIRNQFLIESLTLSVLGGMIGLLIGLLIGAGVTYLVGIPFVVSTFSIIIPFAVSGTIGMVFGIYPAVRASKLDPIVALRSV